MPIQSYDPVEHMSPEESYCCPNGMPMPDEHYVALGKFLFACAQIETAAHLALRRMIPLEDVLSRTLVGQPRLDDLLNTISKCCAHLQYTKIEFDALREIRSHISYIYRVRNIVAHQEPTWRDGWLRYDRYLTAKDISQRESLIYVVRLVELNNLTAFAQSVRDAFGSVTRTYNQKFELYDYIMPKLQASLETLELPADPERPFRQPQRPRSQPHQPRSSEG